MTENLEPETLASDVNALEIQKRELALEVQRKQLELDRLDLESKKGRGWRWIGQDSGFVVILVAALAVLANTIVGYLGMLSAEKVELLDQEKTLMLRAVQPDEVEERIQNLQFFLDLGWLEDQDGVIAKAIADKAVPRIPPPSGPGVAFNIITDGGFETQSGWEILPSSTPAQYVTSPKPVFNGLFSMQLGSLDGRPSVDSRSSARQTIAIPANVIMATLSARIHAVGGQPQDPLTYGEIAVVIPGADSTGNVLYRSSSNEASWQLVNFDLTQYRGRIVDVVFSVRNSNATTSQQVWFVDDVSVIVVIQ